MRIPSFAGFVKANAQPLVLRDTTVVVDGLNFFFYSYKDSGLLHEFGCESHRYASYLRKRLAMFKTANIKCYFIFKGGNKKIEKRLGKVPEYRTICPVFMTSIYREVLDEMGFESVTCEYESKNDIVELARALECPVISFDIEYCFSGLQYIPRIELKFNEINNSIDCCYFLLDNFLHKYRLTEEKTALFIVLTDENIFCHNFFLKFFKRTDAPWDYYERNIQLLNWLSRREKENILQIVFMYLSEDDQQKFVDEIAKAELVINRRQAGGLGAACLLNPAAAAVTPGDPNWFSKGVAANHIAIHYINLYRNKCIFNCYEIKPDNPMLLSLEIVKYAYDLLTNFQNDGFTCFDTMDYTDSGMDRLHVSEMYLIRKPEYEASVCVFENGWGGVRELGLFQHFLKETLQLAQLEPLDQLPEDARLLAVALAYFSRKKRVDTSAEAACVLLSYVTLSLVLEKCDKRNLPKFPFPSKPILDSTPDRSTVTDDDCNITAAIMSECLRASEEEIDQETLFPLQEFQHCLSELNDLNVLCGAPLPPTPYHRAYSGSLVYRLRRAAGPGDSQPFFDKLLGPAPTVYAFLNGLIEVYEAL